MEEFLIVLGICVMGIFSALFAVGLVCSEQVSIPKPRSRLFRIRVAIDTGAEVVNTCYTFRAKTSVEAVEMLKDCISESLPLNYRVIEGAILD